jgi:hypothetical protein
MSLINDALKKAQSVQGPLQVWSPVNSPAIQEERPAR